MEDIAEFDNRESVTHAAYQALEKEGIDLSAPSPSASSPQCLNEVNLAYLLLYVTARIFSYVSLYFHFQNSVFGVPLSSTWRCSVVQCRHRSVAVPKFLADAINFLEDYLNLEGIFRKAGSLTRLKEIKVKNNDCYVYKH